MFDFGLGTSELLLIAMVALIVVGPKELPGLLRTLGRWMRQLKALSADFQSHLNELTRETGVRDVKESMEKDLQELSIEDLDREFREMEAKLRQELEAGARQPTPASKEAAENLLTEDGHTAPAALDLDAEADSEEAGEDGERADEEDEDISEEELDRQFEEEMARDEIARDEEVAAPSAPIPSASPPADTGAAVSSGPELVDKAGVTAAATEKAPAKTAAEQVE